MEQSNHYFLRLLARFMDVLLIGLAVQFVQSINQDFYGNPIIWFLVYNFIVILLSGKSLGKFCFALSINSKNRGFKKGLNLILREILIVVLLPIVLINFLFVARLPLHDRICGTKVTRNEF